MMALDDLLAKSAERHHDHLCPRQILGVRIGMYAGELLAIDLPQNDKRLFAFVETDGCLVDGITAATECSCGHRTMRILDYGKTAATFVDTTTNRAIRIIPAPQSRRRACDYAPDAPDRWHAQLAAYQVMPAEELLLARDVRLGVSMAAILSRHGHRVVCECCGEDIINERELMKAGHILCRVCAGDGYYRIEEYVPAGSELIAVKTRLPPVAVLAR